MDFNLAVNWVSGLVVGIFSLIFLGFWFWVFVNMAAWLVNKVKFWFKKPLSPEQTAEQILKEGFKQDLKPFIEGWEPEESSDPELLRRYARVDYLTEFERRRVRKLLKSGQRPIFD